MKKIYLILAIFALVFLSGCQSTAIKEAPQEQPPAVSIKEGVQEVNAGNEVCPVSGRQIQEETKATYEYKGVVYNFCSPECIEVFKRSPRRFIEIVNAELKARAQEKERLRQKEIERQSEPIQAPHQEHVF